MNRHNKKAHPEWSNHSGCFAFVVSEVSDFVFCNESAYFVDDSAIVVVGTAFFCFLEGNPVVAVDFAFLNFDAV